MQTSLTLNCLRVNGKGELFFFRLDESLRIFKQIRSKCGIAFVGELYVHFSLRIRLSTCDQDIAGMLLILDFLLIGLDSSFHLKMHSCISFSLFLDLIGEEKIFVKTTINQVGYNFMVKQNLITELIIKWAGISSSSHDEKGLQTMLETLSHDFSRLQPETLRIHEKKVCHLTKRKEAPLQILLGGHCDTVFTPESCKVEKVGEKILRGAGVADMKGGLAILLFALEAFEKEGGKEKVGWEIFINSDEEIGSPHSTPFIEECARRCHLALLFEPSFPDGTLVSQRRGSANYILHSRGKESHVGRDFKEGKNAIVPLAKLLVELDALNSETIIVNIGKVEGGGPLNQVPSYATAGINCRVVDEEGFQKVEKQLLSSGMEWECTSKRLPKQLDKKSQDLFFLLRKCGEGLGKKIDWRPSGGVCDGNTIANLGLPTIDTLGGRGGDLHTSHEYLELDSLSSQVELVTHFLNQLAKAI